MSRLLLNTRVTLGISFCPSCTSGFAISGRSFSLSALYSASLERRALAAQDHRTDRDALVFFIQVRNDECRLIGSDPAGLRVASKEFDGVPTRQERETGVVSYGTLGQLSRRGVAQLDVHLVANVRNRGAELVFYLAGEIDEGAL